MVLPGQTATALNFSSDTTQFSVKLSFIFADELQNATFREQSRSNSKHLMRYQVCFSLFVNLANLNSLERFLTLTGKTFRGRITVWPDPLVSFETEGDGMGVRGRMHTIGPLVLDGLGWGGRRCWCT